MKILVLLVSITVAVARPDVSLGYRYQVPVTSYGVPSGSVGSLTNRQYYPVGALGSRIGDIGPTVPSTVFQTPIHEHTAFAGTGSPSVQGSFNLGTGTTSLKILPQNVASGSGLGYSSSAFNSAFGSTGGSSGVSTFNLPGSNVQNRFSGVQQVSNLNVPQQKSQQVEVQKHLYFYSAPDEPEEVRPRINIPTIPAKKDVKILFIKAPTFSAPAPIQIPVQPQNEEKTLVYVLVKKPEEQGQIVIPTPAPIKPSKPEVYFIKYKTQKEAEDVISNVRSGVVSGGGSVSANSVEGDQDFINTIGRDIDTRNQGNNGINLISTSLSGSVDADSRFVVDQRTPFINERSFISGSTGGLPSLSGSSLNSGGSLDTTLGFVSSTTSPSGLFDTSDLRFNVGVNSGSQGSDGSTVVTTGLRYGDGSSNSFSSSGSHLGGVTVSGVTLDGNLGGFSSSTTVSPLDSFAVTGRTSGISGIHETYGPPKIPDQL